MHTATISPAIFKGIRIVNRPDLENVMRLDRGPFRMIGQMERNGMRISPPHLRMVHARCTDEMETLAAKVEQQTGKRINLGSGDQLADLLFKHLGLKQNGREKWTKSRERLAADSDVLKAMVSQHPAIRTILDWKEREKLRSTYTLSLIAKVDDDDRLHSDISSTRTDTGRLASSNPNLQNIPTRTDLGREIRNAFIPRAGNVMGSVDASQIEMRMNAHDSKCKNMMRFFHEGEDFYWGTASLMYRREFPKELRSCKCPLDSNGKKVIHVPACPTVIVAPGEVFNGLTYKKWYRDICAKVTALMVGYDASAGGLYDQFLAWGVPGWSEDLCAKAIIDYFKGYPELMTAKKVHHQRALRYGFVWELFGRIRWIPQMRSVHKRVVGEGQRQAGNLAGQGGAAGVIKLWMTILWESFIYWERHGLEILMQVHDELLVEGPKQVVLDFLNEARETLRHMFDGLEQYYTVPLDGSIGIGDLGTPWGGIDH